MTDETAPFCNLAEFRELLGNLPRSDENAQRAAAARNDRLTKPAGSLGRLEQLAIWFSGWRGVERPELNSPQIVIFAGNHGIASRGVSAFPAEVTEQMVHNFDSGGAAINQIARQLGARLDTYAIDLEHPTTDFTKGPAMTETETVSAIEQGWISVGIRSDLLVVGEMGIGNTAAASAMSLALFGGDAADWTGRGTGVEDDAFDRKIRVVSMGVERNRGSFGDGLDITRCLGGREIAAMIGAIVRARYLSIPVILDGFVCTAAAAALSTFGGDTLEHVVAGHRSAEAAHGRLLERLGMEPILDLDMRLGEGSGAAVAINILKSALACHNGMATFEEAAISES